MRKILSFLAITTIGVTTAAIAAGSASGAAPPDSLPVIPSGVVEFVDAEAPGQLRRTDLGFPKDLGPNEMAEANRNGTAAEGLPLSDAELSELEVRERIWSDHFNPDVITEIAGEHYAGIFVDQASGGKAVISLSAEQEIFGKLQAEIRQRFDSSSEISRLSFQRVSHNEDRLLEVKEHLTSILIDNRQIEGVGIDTSGNGLVIMIADITSDGEAKQAVTQAVRSILGSAPGLKVEVMYGTNEDDSCTSRTSCGGTSDRRAGVRVNRVGPGGSCTSGFAIKIGTDEDILTAGHCWYGYTSGTINTADSGGQSFGWINSINKLYHNTYCDCRIIDTDDSLTTPSYIYYADWDKARRVTAKQQYPSQGSMVRLRATQTQSYGYIQYESYDYYNSTCGCTVKFSTLASYSSADGDSGGPITTAVGATAAGIHSGRSSGYGRYFSINNIETIFGGTILT